MVQIKCVQEWLAVVVALGATQVWIDDGGLALQADNDGFYEIGGRSEDAASLEASDATV